MKPIAVLDDPLTGFGREETICHSYAKEDVLQAHGNPEHDDQRNCVYAHMRMTPSTSLKSPNGGTPSAANVA